MSSAKTRPRPEAILFDLDGTLVDSRRDIADALGRALEVHGRVALPLPVVLPMIGDGARSLVTRALATDDDALVTRVLATFRERYLAAPCAFTTLLPGAREALAAAPRRAIVTNKPRDITLRVLEGLGIAADVVWGGDDGPMKPAPDGLLAVLATLDVAPNAAWMVGDGPQDIGAGHAAGCFTIGVPGIAERERLEAAKPDLVVESLHDVAALAR